MHFLKESLIYHSVRLFAFIIRSLPVGTALAVGRGMGSLVYFVDRKRRRQVYANLKIAFADIKTPRKLKEITKKCFQSYGQNLIELFRMPLIAAKEDFGDVVVIEGKEHVDEALKQGKGVILLAMHFGSWEIASFSCAMLGHPYKVITKEQKKYSRLDELLNSYRSCGGQVVLTRGMGMRDFLRSLKNNEIIGMVVDQGGRDGVLVPFFGRKASLSVGAIRMGLKNDVPICFAIIIREKGSQHRMILHKPFQLDKSADTDKDVEVNLKKVVAVMEDYIRKYPTEYMWFYKIWKYSNEANVVILADHITGHLRQSQALAKAARFALSERNIQSTVQEIPIEFRSPAAQKIFSFSSVFFYPFMRQGRVGFLRWFLKPSSIRAINAIRADFIISCGASLAGVNKMLTKEHNAKSISILRPGMFRAAEFDMVVLPLHDAPADHRHTFVGEDELPYCIVNAAPNLITPEYLKEQTDQLIRHYTHLQGKVKSKIGVLIGGLSKEVYVSDHQIKILIHQLKEAAGGLKMDILCTTSRRTPASVDQLLLRDFKKDPCCPLLIIANQENLGAAVGGIMGLSDILVVSGESISMISEAATSGKKVIVFFPETKAKVLKNNKHFRFIKNLQQSGYIYACSVKDVGRAIMEVAKGKISMKKLDDQAIILEAMRYVI